MDQTTITDELKEILKTVTGKDFSDMDMDKSLFSVENGVKARDAVYFFLMIEEKYGIVFPADLINRKSFFTLNQIAGELCRCINMA